jgi:putative phosphoesterase
MEKPELILHLGDYATDGEKIAEELGINIIIVKGNGDPVSNHNDYELINIEGKKVFLTHGHKHNVNEGIDNIYYKGLELGADIILYGHTHIPVNIKENNIIIMNPGSPTLPRANNKIPTFGIINIEETITTEIIQI